MARLPSARLLWCSAAVAVLLATTARAQEKPAKAKAAADKPKATAKDGDKPAAEEKDEDPYALPKDATPGELVKFAKELAPKRVRSLEEMQKKLGALEKASTAILAHKDIDEETAVMAVRMKISVYQGLERFGDEDAAGKARDFIKSLKEDKRPGVVAIVAEESLKLRAAELPEMKAKERHEYVNDVVEHLQKSPPSIDTLRLAYPIAQAIEQVDGADPAEAAEAYERFGAILARAKDEKVKAYGVKFGGIARRLRLPGNAIEIEGTTLDGKPFDIKKLEGKVVLIDFWATWCGPCIAELPNVKKNYERYHAKGFEVVGISLDESREDLEAFVKEKEIPWVTLFGTDEKTTGWDHPMAARYGIMGIPAVILVDQKGKVVELRARGKRLGEQLEKLLGPVEDKSDKKPAADE